MAELRQLLIEAGFEVLAFEGYIDIDDPTKQLQAIKVSLGVNKGQGQGKKGERVVTRLGSSRFGLGTMRSASVCVDVLCSFRVHARVCVRVCACARFCLTRVFCLSATKSPLVSFAGLGRSDHLQPPDDGL